MADFSDDHSSMAPYRIGDQARPMGLSRRVLPGTDVRPASHDQNMQALAMMSSPGDFLRESLFLAGLGQNARSYDTLKRAGLATNDAILAAWALPALAGRAIGTLGGPILGYGRDQAHRLAYEAERASTEAGRDAFLAKRSNMQPWHEPSVFRNDDPYYALDKYLPIASAEDLKRATVAHAYDDGVLGMISPRPNYAPLSVKRADAPSRVGYEGKGVPSNDTGLTHEQVYNLHREKWRGKRDRSMYSEKPEDLMQNDRPVPFGTYRGDYDIPHSDLPKGPDMKQVEASELFRPPNAPKGSPGWWDTPEGRKHMNAIRSQKDSRTPNSDQEFPFPVIPGGKDGEPRASGGPIYSDPVARAIMIARGCY